MSDLTYAEAQQLAVQQQMLASQMAAVQMAQQAQVQAQAQQHAAVQPYASAGGAMGGLSSVGGMPGVGVGGGVGGAGAGGLPKRLRPPPSSPAPSRVLHLRGLPPYTSEGDLVAFFSSLPLLPPVQPARVLLLPNSNQAFVQLGSVEEAGSVLAAQAAAGGSFVGKGGKSLVLQYSTRAEIHTPTGGMPSASAASGSPTPPQQSLAQGSAVPSLTDPQSSEHANSILLVTVLNTRVSVTLEHLQQIFKPYGDVLRIISFVKGGVFKALVQLSSVEAAVNAKLYLNGKDIFANCCTLRIGFSTLPDLIVKTPGNNARDFTTATGASIVPHALTPSQPHSHHAQAHPHHAHAQGGFGTEGAYGSHPHSHPHHPAAAAAAYQPAAGGYPAYTSDPYAAAAAAAAAAPPSQQSASHHPHHGSVPPPPPPPPASPQQPGCVVLVSNLPEGPGPAVTPHTLFTLFGVYGDVARVKILYNKRDTALVQYLSPHSAYLATLHLNHLSLWGRQLSVTPSKHVEVSMPKAGGATGGGTAEEQLGLTQDYSNAPSHRFKRSAGAASASGPGGALGAHAKSIHPPSAVLHVSSLAEGVSEEEVREMFRKRVVRRTGENGEEIEETITQRPPVVQFFTSLRAPGSGASGPPGAAATAGGAKVSKQAFLRFDSVSDAVENLLAFHNQLLGGRYLRISFSGKDPAQVVETRDGVPLSQLGGGADGTAADGQASAAAPATDATAASSAPAAAPSPSSSPASSSGGAGSVASPVASTASTAPEGQAMQQE